MNIAIRPRRNRHSSGIRNLAQENHLHLHDFIWPLFVTSGTNTKTPIPSMPDVYRWTLDLLVEQAQQAYHEGIQAVALFPALDDDKKDKKATHSKAPDGLLQNTIRALKDAVPDMVVITDVAMDPYSSDGHDGYVENGQILNDPTLEILAEMAISQAQAGADVVAPSDMMDGRINYIRQALDKSSFTNVGILAYSAKYASSFYGPFRDALDSAPKEGDKKTYQMNPANAREALREIKLDVAEGADMVMVKPAMPYLDIIYRVKQQTNLPVAAYQVSGEYAMLKAAANNGWLEEEKVFMESLLGIKRAGADIILTYYARRAAQILA
jgi:porphobilinogen synthase